MALVLYSTQQFVDGIFIFLSFKSLKAIFPSSLTLCFGALSN